MKLLKIKTIRGFTIIELLIVIAVLGLLAVALLVTINPGEAQKKTRDAQRLAHLKILQTFLVHFINDGNMAAGNIAATTGANSAAIIGQSNQQCGVSSWLGIDTCSYAAIVPLDPNNGVVRTFVTNATATPPTTGQVVAQYRARILGSDYEINVLQESTANASKISNDGGNSLQWIELGTDLTLLN